MADTEVLRADLDAATWLTSGWLQVARIRIDQDDSDACWGALGYARVGID